MKRLVVLISILAVVFLSFLSAFTTKASVPLTSVEVAEVAQIKSLLQGGNTNVKKVEREKDINVTPVADVNAAKAETKEPTELEKELKRVSRKSQKEIREWTRSTTENRTTLAKAVEEQVTDELNFIRDIAVKEGAEKTTEAIDAVLASRTERYQTMIKQMEEQAKKTQTRRERGQPRDTRSRDRTKRQRSRDNRTQTSP